MEAEDAINAYTPREITPETWVAIRETVLGWVRSTFPSAAQTALVRTRVSAHYLSWCLAQGFPIEAERVLTEDLIEAWFASDDVAVLAKGTYRSHLRTVAKANTKLAVWTPTPQDMRRDSIRGPYTPAEVQLYRDLVMTQGTARRRRVFDVILHLGLGFGLTSSEICSLSVCDITQQDGLVLASVNERVVPARAPYAQDIVRLIEETQGGRILGDHLKDHRRLDRLVKTLDIPTYAPRLIPRRLRTTWLIDVLSDSYLSIAEFQKVSGLTSGRVLDDLVPFVPVDDTTYLRRAAGQ